MPETPDFNKDLRCIGSIILPDGTKISPPCTCNCVKEKKLKQKPKKKKK